MSSSFRNKRSAGGWRPLLCAALAGLSAFACDVGPPPPKHLLLVTLDTTRADRLGCYGRAAAGTPTLDGLAARGTRFERAYAQVPLTLPSHVSILTGLYPSHSGIHVNGQTDMQPGVRTLAEILSEQGFYTAAAVGGYPVAGSFPVSRGFMSYDDRMADPRNPSGLERDAGKVVAAAGRQLDGADGRRLFMWVHFFDPHDPYEPPPPYDERFADDPYQGEIARVDAALATLISKLDASLDLEDVLVCVVGDHGEGLGEHGEPTHGFFLYEPTVRVPLILAGPRVPEGRTISEAVQTVDIVPTLLQLLDLPIHTGLDGRAADLEAESSGADEPIYLETELPYRNYGWSPLRGVVRGRLKYVEAPRPELYDLDRDPHERENLAERLPDEAAGLAAWISDVSVPTLDARPRLDPRLSALGYVSSGPTRTTGLADPKEMLDTYIRFLTANRFLEAGQPEKALPLLDRLVEEEGTVGARFKRAQAWRMTGRFDDAEAELTRLEREDPSLTAVPFEIARIAIWTGRPKLALDELQKYLKSSPTDAEALMFRGAAREKLGDPAGAEVDYRRALELNPEFYAASLRLCALLVNMGRVEEARERLGAHLKRYPNDDIARGLLGSL